MFINTTTGDTGTIYRHNTTQDMTIETSNFNWIRKEAPSEVLSLAQSMVDISSYKTQNKLNSFVNKPH